MMKNYILSIIVCFFISFPAFALKVTDEYLVTSKIPYKVEFRKVFDGQTVSLKAGKTLFTARLSGIICNEHNNKYDIFESTAGQKYSVQNKNYKKSGDGSYYLYPGQYNKAEDYLKKLLEANENNLYLQQQGRGYTFSIVGELFVGNKSVNKLLVEKGFCRPIE